eukprot:5012849-Pyramimonas_sp.AAC.1
MGKRAMKPAPKRRTAATPAIPAHSLTIGKRAMKPAPKRRTAATPAKASIYTNIVVYITPHANHHTDDGWHWRPPPVNMTMPTA